MNIDGNDKIEGIHKVDHVPDYRSEIDVFSDLCNSEGSGKNDEGYPFEVLSKTNSIHHIALLPSPSASILDHENEEFDTKK